MDVEIRISGTEDPDPSTCDEDLLSLTDTSWTSCQELAADTDYQFKLSVDTSDNGLGAVTDGSIAYTWSRLLYSENLVFFRTPLCGDGSLDPGEECDDGNTADGDRCDSTCKFVCDDLIANKVQVGSATRPHTQGCDAPRKRSAPLPTAGLRDFGVRALPEDALGE
jgi:cysteine-rich repeat protein